MTDLVFIRPEGWWQHLVKHLDNILETWGWWKYLCLWEKDQTWSPHAPTTQSRQIQPWVSVFSVRKPTKRHHLCCWSTKLAVVSMAAPESFRQCRLSYSPRWRADRSNSKLRPRFLKNNHNSWNRNLDSEETRKSRKFSTHHPQQCDMGNEHPTKKKF